MAAAARKHDIRPAGFAISVTNEQTRYVVDEAQLAEAVLAVLRQSSVATAEISLAIVDDDTMQELNRRYLNHDWPTDVLSFPLEQRDGHLVGEVILSADTAATTAADVGWAAHAEQMLYVIHGVLHLVGFRDKTPGDRRAMQAAEDRLLRDFGLIAPRRRRNDRVTVRRPDASTPAGAKLR